MKKIISTLAISAIAAASAVAQNMPMNMRAFNNVGIGIEAGLMGAGIQVSMPMVTNHLVLVLGYNLPKIGINADFNVSSSELRGKIQDINSMISQYNSQASGAPGYTKIDQLSCPNGDINVDVKSNINFGAVKAMVEYYPSSTRTFHFIAGVFFGQGDFISVDGTADSGWWQTYQQAIQTNSQLPAQLRVNGLEDAVKFNVDEQTIQLKPNSNGKVDLSVATNKVKPYIGIGLGRPIPNKRVGFQWELGAWMHGKPTFKSDSEVKYDPSATEIDGLDIVRKIQFWPQMTFRLTGRIF